MIHETFEKTLLLWNLGVRVRGVHRDWNPLPGIEPPEGTVWEVTLRFEDPTTGKEAEVPGTSTESKEEAIMEACFRVGVRFGACWQRLYPDKEVR